MKVSIKILILIMSSFLIVWGVSLARCEILTFIHGAEFTDLYETNTMLGEQEYLKILEYSDEYAKIYYVGTDNSMGNILSFVKNGEHWDYYRWERCVWSTSGNADGIIWPYWWHFFYSHQQLS